MPEITIPVVPGLRDVGNGPSEKTVAELKKLREEQRVQLWSHSGTEEDCERNWEEFLLLGTPDWIIYS